jgi:hypothetical protein
MVIKLLTVEAVKSQVRKRKTNLLAKNKKQEFAR